MTPHLVFPMTEVSQVGDARRRAAELAEQAGFDETHAGRLGLVVTELGNNLVLHAKQGRLLVAVRGEGGHAQVEVLSIDEGPGMSNVEACLADGYSTAGTPGTGLGAVRRLSDAFDIYSAVDQGTVVAATVRAHDAPRALAAEHEFEVSGLCVAAPGETVSGDGWACIVAAGRAVVMMADGLGHGPQAAEASDLAIQMFAAHADSRPQDIVQSLHGALRSTRGAAVAVAELDAAGRCITFCGVGNIVGRLMSATQDKSMLSQHGTAGVQIRSPRDIGYDWPDHSLLILHSDGIATRWDLSRSPAIVQHSTAVIAAWILRDFSRGRDDATVVVVRAIRHRPEKSHA